MMRTFYNQNIREPKQLCEGDLTEKECFKALKNMKIIKSPGNDGFKTEFYNFFWLDVKQILVKSFNESYSEHKFTISQRQGIITWIPKERKSIILLKKLATNYPAKCRFENMFSCYLK